MSVRGQAHARERIRIVGAASGIGLIQPAAESFANHWHQDMPALEATGAALGFELFCAGIGFEHPDAVVTFRPITEGELASCGENGVYAVTQIEIGREAMVLAGSAESQPLDIGLGELFTALAARVGQGGRVVANPHRRWSQVSPSLPDREILVMAPEPNASAFHLFQELAMAEGCKTHAAVMELDPADRQHACRDLRDDGHLVPAAKRENDVIEWLQSNPGAYAVTSYSRMAETDGLLSASALEGVAPTPANLASARYPLTATLSVYVKDRHLRPISSLQRFVYELTSERAISPEGYLAESGLVPLDEASRNHARDQALRLGL